MDITISNDELRRLASDDSYRGEYPAPVVARFRQTLQIIAAAHDESVLTQFKCLAYRKAGGRGTVRRLTLTEDAELIVRYQNGAAKPAMVVDCINRERRKSR
jgi:plasmid maintenance system killer protein